MAKLRVVEGPLTGTEFSLDGGAAVAGRHMDCDVLLPDPKASRNHAEFIPDREGRFSIIDVGSSNGTDVNGIQLPPSTPRPLCPGDEIRIGQNILRYFAGETDVPDLVIPEYILEEILAEGGMGAIFKARNRSTGHHVAIKILHPGYAKHEEFVGRFIQEARAAGRLSHPNIIKVHNVGKTANGRYYITMELVNGSTLTQKLASLSTRQTARILYEITDALEYAHRRGIIHRDIKPDNIMVNHEGEPKLTDLGIAVLDQQDVAQGGSKVLGTPHYMSPEQASGKTLTAATDLYSLGATFFHAFSGQPPFDASDPQRIMMKHVREQPQSLGDVAPKVPERIAAVIDRLLEKKPSKRYATAAKLKTELAAAIEASYPNLLPAPPALEREGKIPLPLVVIGLVCLIAALFYALFIL